jgi:hypothetical protein
VNIQRAVRWDVEGGLGEDLAVGGDDEQVGLKCGKLLEGFRDAESLGLDDGQPEAEGALFYGAGLGLEFPSAGAVGLSHHTDHIRNGAGVKGDERRTGQFGGAHVEHAGAHQLQNSS